MFVRPRYLFDGGCTELLTQLVSQPKRVAAGSRRFPTETGANAREGLGANARVGLGANARVGIGANARRPMEFGPVHLQSEKIDEEFCAWPIVMKVTCAKSVAKR